MYALHLVRDACLYVSILLSGDAADCLFVSVNSMLSLTII